MDKESREFLENMASQMNMRFDNVSLQVKEDTNTLKGLFDSLSIQVKENTSMLIGLEENAKITRAEIEKVAMDVVHIKGNMEALRKDICNVEIITSSNWTDIAKLKAVK